MDTHCHLEMYANNTEQALSDLKKNAIVAISLSNGIPSYERTLDIATRCEMVIPGFGIHPHNAPEVMDHLDVIREYAYKCIVLGEIGLDHFFAKDSSTYPLQEELLKVFLEVAEKNDAILSIHSRGADLKVAAILDSFHLSRVVIHGFDQGMEVANQLTDRGIYLSFGPLISERYSDIVPQWDDVREAASNVPDDLLLMESDAPGSYTDEMPSERIFQVLSILSSLRLQPPRDTQDLMNRNFLRLIAGIPQLEGQRSLVQSDM
ncbi:MAG: TatD family hydrolase [Candidatus Thorarchaeota archaeon]